MSALRFLAMLLFLVATLAFATDASRAYLGEGTLFTPLLKHWSDLAPTALASARRSLVGATHPAVWDWLVAPVLAVPAWITFGFLAVVMSVIGRRRRRVNIFAN